MSRSFLTVALSLFGCANTPIVWAKMSYGERVAAINSIADECKLSRDALSLTEQDELTFGPAPGATFDSVDCALKKLKALRGLKNMGFIGNEAVAEEKK